MNQPNDDDTLVGIDVIGLIRNHGRVAMVATLACSGGGLFLLGPTHARSLVP